MKIPPEIASRFRIERLLGQGGMGVVFRAVQVDLSRSVALKLLVPALASNPEFRARFLDEARLAARVVHPNLVRLYDFDVLPDGTAYIAYALIEGTNLGDLIIDRPPTADRATHIARDVCAALRALHSADIVHRDVKPQNVIVDTDGAAHRTRSGSMEGPASTGAHPCAIECLDTHASWLPIRTHRAARGPFRSIRPSARRTGCAVSRAREPSSRGCIGAIARRGSHHRHGPTAASGH